MHAGGITLRWVGRILVLVAPFVIFCSLFLPSAVQWLNPVVCPEGLVLDNAAYSSAPINNERLELVCTSPFITESAAAKVALVVVGFVTAGLVCLYVSQRMLNPRYRAPTQPNH